MINNELYFASRDKFFYIEALDKSKIRENIILDILDESNEKSSLYYHSNFGPRVVENIKYAKFWKDKHAAVKELNTILTNKNLKVFNLKVIEINRDTFINKLSLVEQNIDIKDHNYIRNLKILNKEIVYRKDWNRFKENYKTTQFYLKVDDPIKWKPCNVCGLIPLVNEYDNMRATGCGCGKNEYEHFSIRAESIMSTLNRVNNGGSYDYNTDDLRINWNNWVINGIDNFKIKKSKYNNIW